MKIDEKVNKDPESLEIIDKEKIMNENKSFIEDMENELK